MNTIPLAFVGFIPLIIRFSSKLGLYTVKLQKEVIINAVGLPEYRKSSSRLITLTALLLFNLLPMGTTAQVKVIDYPDYRFKNTGIETISRIELHDTITKVHVHVTFIPKWWIEYDALSYIQPVGSGERYHLIGIENAKMNKRLSTASGEANYVLFFHPLDKSVKEIHYGNVKNNKEEISIFNVSLEESFNKVRYEKSREIPSSIAKRLTDEETKTIGKETSDFDSDAFFDTSPARLVGFIRGYMADSTRTFPITTRGMDGRKLITPLKVYPDGYFEADFLKLDYARMLSFSLLKAGTVTFYIEPGHTLSMILDWEDVLNADRYRDRNYILANTEFGGTLSGVNRDLLKRIIFKPHGFEMERRMKNMSPVDHRQDLEARINDNLEILRETNAEHPLCPKAKRLIENEIKADALSELLQFSTAYLRRETLDNETPLSTDYYSLLEMLPTNDRSLLSTLSAERLLLSLNFAGIMIRPANIYTPEFKPGQSFGDYLVAKGIVVSSESKKLLPLIQTMLESPRGNNNNELTNKIKENQEAIQQFIRIHSNDYFAYYKEYSNFDPIESFQINTWKREEILTDSLGLEGVFKDAAMYLYHCTWLNMNSKLDPRDLNFATEFSSGRLSNPVLKEHLSEYSYLTPGSAYIDFTEKTVTGEAFILSTLISRKRLILLDFWASTCIACTQNVSQLQETYDRYKDKGLEIVTISIDKTEFNGRESSRANDMSWIRIICDNSDNLANILKQYKVRSLPYTVLIDHTGTIIAVNLQGKELTGKIEELLE